MSATAIKKPWYWRDVLLDSRRGDSGTLGVSGISCSVVVLAENKLVEVVFGGRLTVPPGPKTTALLVSLEL